MSWRHWVALLIVVLLTSAPAALARKGEPDRVKVQHILIGFKNTIPGTELKRNRRDAKVMALKLLERAEAGEDFDALVKEHTDEKYPGIYLLTNNGVPLVPGGYKRTDMVLRFGDVAFKLEVGEVGLASHHAELAPFGYHVIKRLPLEEGQGGEKSE